jgi:CubicO group peptidase (beta-lactamase class C family)
MPLLLTMKKLYILLLSCGLVYSACSQQKYSTEVEEQIRQVENSICGRVIIEGESQNILERMKVYNVKGLSVAVVHNYKIVWAKGYGWADEKEKRPVTAETLFEPGSISKSLNSLGVLKLVQEKKLDLDTDINTYLKSWKFPYDSVSHEKKITLRQLLSHSAGLTVHGFPGYDRKDKIPTVPEVLDGKKPANTPAVRSFMEPGVKFQYSGGGTTITQLIIKDVTGQAYDTFMYENVLKPIGMVNSSYSQPPSADKQKLCATGYYPNGNAVNNKFHVYPEQAAAGLWMTPSDLCNYIIETQLAYEGRSAKVLNQEMTKLRLTPYKDISSALGCFMEERKSDPKQKESTMYFQHGAGNEGFCGFTFGSLDGQGNGIAVFTNHQNTPLLFELINSVARVYKWKDFPGMPETRKQVDVSEKSGQKYLGVYQAAPNTFTHLVKKEDGYYQFAEGSYNKMYFTSDTSYFNKEFQNEKYFIADKNGNVTGYKRLMNGQWLAPHIRLTEPVIDTLKGSEDFFNTISWHLIESKESAEALKYLKRAFDFYPNSLSLKGNQAHAYLLKGDYDQAIEIYRANMGKIIWEDLQWEKMIQNDLLYFKNQGLYTKLMDKVFADLKIKMPAGFKD